MVNPKKIIRHCLIFTVLFLSMLFIADLITEKFLIYRHEQNNAAKLDQLIHSTDPLQAPIFGSSKARSAFIPDSLGSHFYNYGMEKCNFDVIEFLLELELEKERNSPIIIEFNHRSFVNNPMHTIDVATFIPSIEDKRVQNYLKRNDRYEFYYHLPGFRYYGSYWNYIRSSFREHTGNDKVIDDGGVFISYVAKPDIMKRFVDSRLAKIERYHELTEKKNNPKKVFSKEERMELKFLTVYLMFDNDKKRIDRFEELVKSAPDRKFFIVYTPQHWSELEGIMNFDEIEALFEHWNNDIPNLYALDYSHMNLADSCFKNSSHINMAGAKLFSQQLNRDIQSILGPAYAKN